ncbi:MAG TPA: ATP-binding protein [Pirellulales bacterium]|nr:ATP-binding protein [Pirellulales bacterium]
MSSPDGHSSEPDTAPAPPVRRRRRRFATASLRTQLIASHLGLAALIVLGFGIAVLGVMWRGVYRQAEADLLAAAQLMLRELAAGASADSLDVTGTYWHRFGPAPRDRAYFAVWDASGRQRLSSGELPIEAAPLEIPPRTHGPHPFETRTYGSHLDVIVATPEGGQLLIGRPLAKEMDGLWRWTAIVGALSLGCLVLAAVAAWWLAALLVRPLVRMASGVEAIDRQTLATRLNIGTAPAEIERLSAAFNRLLDRLQAAFERQVRFTADASHELRTPLSIILSQIEHTLSRERTEAQYREALDTCLRAGRRMRSLVDDLLLLARADAGSLANRLDTVDLATIAGEAVALLQPLADANRVTLTADLASAMVHGDRDQLGRVVWNLVTNALQYNVPAGRCTVEVRPRRAQVFLVVRDTGVGIPAEAIPHLFERFYRGDSARTVERVDGTGLGLSLVAEIVAAHGGTIAVDSQPGRGASFTVQLPAAQVLP